MVVASIILAPALVHPGTALPGQSGMADLPGTVNFHWLVHTHSFSELRQSTMLMYPSEMDRLLLDGMPLDALISLALVSSSPDYTWPEIRNRQSESGEQGLKKSNVRKVFGNNRSKRSGQEVLGKFGMF